MGNRVVQYFFNWLKWSRGEDDATAWIKCYVHTFFAVGPPWLGAPKIGRALISGEAMGLDHFLFGKERLRLARSCGSIGCLLPIEKSKFVINDIESFYYLRKKDEDQFYPCPLKDLLQACDARHTVECVDKNFMNNPLYGQPSEDQPMVYHQCGYPLTGLVDPRSTTGRKTFCFVWSRTRYRARLLLRTKK